RTELIVFCIDGAWQSHGTASRSRCATASRCLSHFRQETGQVTAHPPAGSSALVEIGEAVRAGMTPLACVSGDTARSARAVTLVVMTSEGRTRCNECHCQK